MTIKIIKQESMKGISLYLYKIIKAAELCITHELILATPALKIKQMKLRQIEKELKALKEKKG